MSAAREIDWPENENTPQDTVRRACPDCPDGNVWDANGPRNETCPTCNGTAFVWIAAALAKVQP